MIAGVIFLALIAAAHWTVKAVTAMGAIPWLVMMAAIF
jgi:hypothetical protein